MIRYQQLSVTEEGLARGPGTVVYASEGQQAASCRSLGRAGTRIRLAGTGRRPWCRGWAEHGARYVRARSLRPRTQAYSPAIGRRPCLRKSALRAVPSRDWTVRPWVAPSMRSWRWTVWEKWPAILTLPGPRFLEGRRGAGDSASSRARVGYFCIRHSDLPGSLACALAEHVFRRRDPPPCRGRGPS